MKSRITRGSEAGCFGLLKAAFHTNVEKGQEMKMPNIDRFVPKERGGQERNAFHSTPYRKMFSELEIGRASCRERV